MFSFYHAFCWVKAEDFDVLHQEGRNIFKELWQPAGGKKFRLSAFASPLRLRSLRLGSVVFWLRFGGPLLQDPRQNTKPSLSALSFTAWLKNLGMWA